MKVNIIFVIHARERIQFNYFRKILILLINVKQICIIIKIVYLKNIFTLWRSNL